ncbi:MAG: hypothetical protein MUQ67_11740 [Pirellulales bacterium]|nr:hypothetical protein [Pirellulales bacterium]MDO7690018.1 hypothetical protein [Pirellulales bacterium]
MKKTIQGKKLPPQIGAAVVKMNAVEGSHAPEGTNPSTRRIVQLENPPKHSPVQSPYVTGSPPLLRDSQQSQPLH